MRKQIVKIGALALLAFALVACGSQPKPTLIVDEPLRIGHREPPSPEAVAMFPFADKAWAFDGKGGGASFSAAAPGAIGGTTSNTGQFTNLCSGASPCTLPGITGSVNVGTVPLLLSGQAAGVTAAATQINADSTIPALEINAPSGSQEIIGVNGGTSLQIQSANIIASVPFTTGANNVSSTSGSHQTTSGQFIAGATGASALGTGGTFVATEGTAPTGTSTVDEIYADSTAHRWKMNNNAGGAVTVVSSADVIAPLQGGTGTALTPTIGDLLKATSSTAFGSLADVAVGRVLISGGVGAAPAWSASSPGTSGQVASMTTAGVLSWIATEAHLSPGTNTFGNNTPFPTGVPIYQTVATNAGHFTQLTSTNITLNAGSCSTAPTFNVFDGASNLGTAKIASATVQAKNATTQQAETLTFAAGDVIGIIVSTAGATCLAPIFNVDATVVYP